MQWELIQSGGAFLQAVLEVAETSLGHGGAERSSRTHTAPRYWAETEHTGGEHAQRGQEVTHRVSKLCSPSKPLAPRRWIRLLCRCLRTKQRSVEM